MTTPTLDLYPPPGRPSDPPTWEDIERLARHYPAAQTAIVLVERGDWTREQALIVLAYALADAFSPPPGRPSDPPTWEDIERLARHYPAAQTAIVLVERGDWTREQALIVLAYALADAFSRLFRAEVERRLATSATTSATSVVFPPT